MSADTPVATPIATAVAKFGGSASWTAATVLLALASILAPMALTAIPPLVDYPNHFARFWLLAGGAQAPPLSEMYAIDWSRASTNIGLDLLVRTLAQAVPVALVGKLVLILAFAGPPVGGAMLHRQAFGSWHWWQAAPALLAWSTTALLGFLSYQAALGAALMFACLEPLFARWGRLSILARFACAGVLLIVHPFGLLFYGALLAALGVGADWRGLLSRPRLLAIVRRGLFAGLVVAVPFGLLLALAPTPPGSHTHTGMILSWPPRTPYYAGLTLGSPIFSYERGLDLLLFAAVIAPLGWAAAVRRLRIHAGLLLGGLGVAVLSLLMPWQVGDAAFVHLRLPLMAALMLFASVRPEFAPASLANSAAAALVLCAVVGKSLNTGLIWSERAADIRAVHSALAHLPAGSALLTVGLEPADARSAPRGRYLAGVPDSWTENSTMRHVASLAVPERRAFVATLFAVPGQQPLRLIPPWDGLKGSSVPEAHRLERQPTPPELLTDPALADWPKRFDYVLLIAADQPAPRARFTPPPALRLVANEGFARLYRVERSRP